jgi:pyruvate dehydrogenase kinase 2/3/4
MKMKYMFAFQIKVYSSTNLSSPLNPFTGGGLMLQESQTPSDLYSFSHLRNNTRLDEDRIGALQHFSQRKGGLRGTVDETITLAQSSAEREAPCESLDETPVPRQMGIGLPLSNIYATYFGGTLELVSMDGWGEFALIILALR